MSKIAVYAGTFDPITNGHLALIERASSLFAEVVVAVAKTARKSPAFSLEQRQAMAKQALLPYANVRVEAFSGLLVDYVQQIGARVILRGLRAASDFDYEFQLAGMNAQMAPEIETLFLPGIGKTSYISSTMVREIVSLGGDPAQFVPPAVLDYLR